MTNSQYQVSRRLEEAFNDSKFSYILYTDGSGYLDHIGGYASVLVSRVGTMGINTSFGCSANMETGRAEFMAILNGLHTILESTGTGTKGEDIENFRNTKPWVLIVSDRMDLVGSINNVYGRKHNGDLWASFEWYEDVFSIEAVHVHRDTVSVHREVDKLASAMRLVLADFINTNKETSYLKYYVR